MSLIRKEISDIFEEQLNAGKVKEKTKEDFSKLVGQLMLLKKNLSESYSQQDLDTRFQSTLVRELHHALYDTINDSLKVSRKPLQSLNIDKFFEFLLDLETYQLIKKQDIFNIFTDLFECASESQLTPLFDIMESKIFTIGLLKLEEREASVLLSMCSKICKIIMRKLSVTHDTGFRGRVQKLIAALFPLTHPSGLNRTGTFNTKNSTNFESLEEIKSQIEQQKQGLISDYKLYKNFWNLQKYLTNPFNIFSNVTLDFEEIDEDYVEPEYDYMDHDKLPKSSQIDIAEDGSIGEEEEGQADNDRSMSIDEGMGKDFQKPKKNVESNLTQVLSTIRDLISRFQSQPLQIDKENAQILMKYPKYLSKYSLLNLQFQDFLFRETFLVQVLIFVQSILNPINLQQKKHFVVQDNEKKLLQNIEQRVYSLLQDQQDQTKHQSILGKRKCMSECAETILFREKFWTKWKENKCTNFEKLPSANVSLRKRDQIRSNKLIGNNIVIQAKEKEFNQPKNGQNIRRYLKQPKETIDAEGKSINLKPSELPTISDYIVPVLTDVDPDQGIEEAYKNKKNQVFNWRFLRALSFVDLVIFHGKPELQKQFNKFEGNIEESALLLQSRNKRKHIDLSNGDAKLDGEEGGDHKNGGEQANTQN